jgi:poly(beta-D-mannuronate) lyase
MAEAVISFKVASLPMRFISRYSLLFAISFSLVGASIVLGKNHAGDVFTLLIWKLTIPYDDDGDGEADEVTQPTLRYFEDPDFFHLSEEGNAVIFRTRTGDPTTKNSEYPRSELREMKKGGKDEISWGTNDGKVHNLTIEAAINAIPKKKPHVVCVQIHDAEDDILMVRLEGKKLFLERNGADDVMLNDNYELGTFFNLMLICDSGRIRVIFERKQVMEWKIERDGLYFKAGCYLQSNLEKGDKADAFGEIAIRKLYVTHK